MEKTKELFDKWSEKKIDIEFYWKGYKVTNIGEIWIENVWVNIGNEISKDWLFQRPCLICTKWMWWDLIWVIPISTKYNNNYKRFLIKIENHEIYWLKYESYLCINQFQIISKKRLVKKINDFNKWKFIKLISKEFIKKVLLNILQ